ncbi:phosphotransferase [Microbispora sp. H10830]|uniref:phosphotransferase n=1 Tax=Microbispora sp. H10830 TaxID=2729109 RepID=UPI001C726D4C
METRLMPWLAQRLPLPVPIPHVLHTADPAEAVRHGAPPPREVLGERAATVKDFGTRVIPLLPDDRRDAASTLLDAVAALPTHALVHGDLGPEHVLMRDGAVSGVIDFSDAHVGDPALDLAWALHAAPPAFARAVAAEYDAAVSTPATRTRCVAVWKASSPASRPEQAAGRWLSLRTAGTSAPVRRRDC